MNKPDTITSLSRERLEDLCMDLMFVDGEKTNTIAKLQERIDKAIYFIKENGCYDDETNSFYDDINYYELSELVSILKGENNE